MIQIRYFARYREMLGCDQEDIDLPEPILTVSKLKMLLADRGEPWSEIFGGQRPVLVAINQDMAREDELIEDGDEVAFFPPVTGG